MLTDSWEWAVIDPRAARQAHVRWEVGRRLPSELVSVAARLGYPEAEIVASDVGELVEDLAVGDDTYLSGALVLRDESGLPAALFGRPLLKKASVEAEK